MFKMLKLKGANMDIDLIEIKDLEWKQDKCPWSVKDGKIHKCAEKNKCICDYFQGIEDPDIILCNYLNKEEEEQK